MIARMCWTGMAGLALFCGYATMRGLDHENQEPVTPASIIETRPRLDSEAAQRYVASHASHWKEIILTR